ncbi:hypothetical protein RhiirC2_113735 [Rhizophagus irregularis]|uniref:Uncharacterized protein n=1 Tax=Rhizophagus irregularis TaxID=588596 RepID=A0A2N1MR45_9GLOM|nr:hypothetical protein RhiirC2_113735 [Rhizophagus irregularis]
MSISLFFIASNVKINLSLLRVRIFVVAIFVIEEFFKEFFVIDELLFFIWGKQCICIVYMIVLIVANYIISRK